MECRENREKVVLCGYLLDGFVWRDKGKSEVFPVWPKNLQERADNPEWIQREGNQQKRLWGKEVQEHPKQNIPAVREI